MYILKCVGEERVDIKFIFIRVSEITRGNSCKLNAGGAEVAPIKMANEPKHGSSEFRTNSLSFILDIECWVGEANGSRRGLVEREALSPLNTFSF
jgi:hypothetical protein